MRVRGLSARKYAQPRYPTPRMAPAGVAVDRLSPCGRRMAGGTRARAGADCGICQRGGGKRASRAAVGARCGQRNARASAGECGGENRAAGLWRRLAARYRAAGDERPLCKAIRIQRLGGQVPDARRSDDRRRTGARCRASGDHRRLGSRGRGDRRRWHRAGRHHRAMSAQPQSQRFVVARGHRGTVGTRPWPDAGVVAGRRADQRPHRWPCR